MLKKTFIVVALILIVAGKGEIEVDQLPNLKGGFVSSLSVKKYSFYRDEVDCENVPSIEAAYKKFRDENIPLLEIDKITKRKDKESKCFIYFKNDYSLDINSDDMEETVTNSIISFQEALANGKHKVLTQLYSGDFLYDSSKKQFFFSNMEKLPSLVGTRENYTGLFNTRNHFDMLIKASIRFFDNWARLTDYFDYQFSHYEVNHNGFSKTSQLEESANMINENAKEPSNVIKIEVLKDESNWKFSASLNYDNNNFSFDENTELFSLYLCQKIDKFNNECINLREKDSQNKMVWNFKVKENHKIFIDVQKVDTLNSSFRLNFYKVYIVLTDIKMMRIVTTSSYQRDIIPEDKLTNGYLVIDNGSEDLKILDMNSWGEETFKMKSKSLTIKADRENEIEVFRIPFAPTLKYFLDFTKNISRESIRRLYAYQIIIPKNNILIFTDEIEEESILPSIHSYLPKKHLFHPMIRGCNNKYLKLKDEFNSPVDIMYFAKEEKHYNCQVELVRNHLYENKIEIFKTMLNKCIDINENSLQPLYKASYIGDYKYFEWNFNTEKPREKNPNNVCYFFINKVYDKEVPNFQTKNFGFPKPLDSRIYLSISMHGSDRTFAISAFYFKNKDLLTEIQSIDVKSGLISAAIPSTLQYILIDQTEKVVNTLNLIDSTVNYLSSQEVVYAVDIAEFKNCKKALSLSVQEQAIAIKCNKKKAAENSENAISKVTNRELSEGLNKVLSQVIKGGMNMI